MVEAEESGVDTFRSLERLGKLNVTSILGTDSVKSLTPRLC